MPQLPQPEDEKATSENKEASDRRSNKQERTNAPTISPDETAQRFVVGKTEEAGHNESKFTSEKKNALTNAVTANLDILLKNMTTDKSGAVHEELRQYPVEMQMAFKGLINKLSPDFVHTIIRGDMMTDRQFQEIADKWSTLQYYEKRLTMLTPMPQEKAGNGLRAFLTKVIQEFGEKEGLIPSKESAPQSQQPNRQPATSADDVARVPSEETARRNKLVRTKVNEMDVRAEDLLKDTKKYTEGSYLGALGVRPLAWKMETSIVILSGQLRVLQEMQSGLSLIHLIEAMNSLELYKPKPETWKLKDYLGPAPHAKQTEERAKRVYEEIQFLIGETRKM